MKETLSILDQAEEVVNTAEAAFINGLFAWETNAQHRAKECKCQQCQHEASRASVAISRELDRVAPEEDEEEVL